ncbi:hypothetical protein BCR34DRAFT_572530 [Clohesyomyces aquaticus]|uniref:Uncharacterized protein n=1 Tax=Clohesyomyces aquaticus TaxID=1231657 RepID=A0A1Y1Z312_9PLEO|nr:hypothetical protein BCR34DRAFT_572530 [Clohesyomyces aquaticus]
MVIMYITTPLLPLFALLIPLISSTSTSTVPCPSAQLPTASVALSSAQLPTASVTLSSAYACKGSVATYLNVTSGICIDTPEFWTARGSMLQDAPKGMECGFLFYAEKGCKGYGVSAGAATMENRGSWEQCVRTYVDGKGEVGERGRSFMLACWGRGG